MEKAPSSLSFHIGMCNNVSAANKHSPKL